MSKHKSMVANKPTIIKLVYDPGLGKKYWNKIVSERKAFRSKAKTLKINFFWISSIFNPSMKKNFSKILGGL